MNKKLIFYYFTICVSSVFLLLNCSKKTKISYSDAQNITYTPQLSTIILPLKISNALLEKKIDTYLPTILYKDSILEDDNYTYTIKKLSKPVILSSDIGFKLAMPVHIDAKTKVDIGGFGGTFPLSADLKPTLLFIPKMTKDWNLTFEVQWLSHEWIEKPSVQAGFFSMDVSGMADQVLNAQKDKITNLISSFLNAKVDVKPSILEFWKQIQQPISIDSQTPLWLHLKPDSLHTSEIKNAQGSLQILLFLKSKPIINNVIVSEEIINLSNQNIEKKSTDPYFDLMVDADIKHILMTKFAQKQLMNQEFVIAEGKKIKISTIEFKNLKQKIAINIAVKGDYEGNMTIFGTPFFDKDTEEIVLKNPNFSVETKNKLHKAAAWLGKGKILKSMSPFLKVSVKEHLEMLQKSIAQSLNNNQIHKNILLNGKVKNCTLHSMIGVSDSTYTFHYIVQGQAEARCNAIDF